MFLKIPINSLFSKKRRVVVLNFYEPSDESKKEFNLPDGFKWVVQASKDKMGRIKIFCSCLGYISSKRKWGNELGACKHIQDFIKNYDEEFYQKWIEKKKELSELLDLSLKKVIRQKDFTRS